MTEVIQALSAEAMIALLLIFALIVAFIVAARRRRAGGYKMNARLVRDESPVPDPHDRTARELPNGGARTVGRQDPTFGEYLTDAEPRDFERAQMSGSNLDEYSDTVDDESTMASVAQVLSPNQATLSDGGDGGDGVGASLDSGTLDWLDEVESISSATVESPRLPRHDETQVHSFNVITRSDTGFDGEDILRVLLGCGLRFGDMDFFHLSELQDDKPTIQFSVANMMQPGVFDLDNMDELKTQGLMFFLTLPGPKDMLKAFDLMLETAHTVAHSLGGDVYDETRSVMTKQYVESLRQSIREYEHKCRV
ncbi:MAG: cell division protein ZipA [Luminiphilus sp.]|nr:cell division protein ZipA [Luminiphilus sp.]